MTTRLTKRSGESRVYTFDFSLLPEIVAGDTLTGTPTVTATNLAISTSTAPTIATITIASGSTVTAVISNGADGTTWLMKCTCLTTGGHTLVCTGYLSIADN